MSTSLPPLVVPPSLKPGDAVGIASPASPYAISKLRRGVILLKRWGYRPVLGRPRIVRKGYLAGTDRERAQELNDLLTDPEIKAVLCSRGGYGTMRILEALDYERIKKQPKIVMGFSDVTALLAALHTQTQLMTFHGPMVATLSAMPGSVQNQIRTMLKGDFGIRVLLRKEKTLCSGSAYGKLIGGNLTVLTHLIGTPFEPPWEGAILFLEDCGEVPYRLDRLFQHLKLSGVLKKISAILLGTFTDPGGRNIPTSIIRAFVEEVKIPVWAGFPVGHGRWNSPIPFGAPAFLDGKLFEMRVAL